MALLAAGSHPIEASSNSAQSRKGRTGVRAAKRKAPRPARRAVLPPVEQTADVQLPDYPQDESRVMRAAEGAIVNIIDSYYPVTCYWTADEVDEGRGPKQLTITVERKDGSRRRVRVSQQFKRRLDVEGTAMLADGRVLNVTSRKGVYDDVTRVANLGLGYGGRGLVPFRSIAVNRYASKGLKLGDRVFIREAVGMRLPSGARHDGYFRVDDVGSGVRGIDIYTLTRQDSELIEQVLRNDRRSLPLYKVLARGQASRDDEFARLD
ncbi:MAG: hypothetical protein HY814_03035 [Candidatus Riflebacteria bacterium]|nr:hypothetical protein [Candidatus Riflebacteria bacterium]